MKKLVYILIGFLCLINLKAGEEVIDTNSETSSDFKDVILPDDPEIPDVPAPWIPPIYVYNIPGNWSYPWLPTIYPVPCPTPYPTPRSTPSPVSPF